MNQGYKVKAVSRNPDSLAQEAALGAEIVQADYDSAASLDAALSDVDAVLFQAPSMGDVSRLAGHCRNLAEAVKRSKVQLFVLNSSMWAPDVPVGQVTYDGVLGMEELFRSYGFPVTTFRPTLFMNNLLGDWIKPNLQKGVYRYAHKPDLASDWICLEDVAKFMIAALKRPELIGQKIQIGGPQRLTTQEVIEIISEAMGRPLRYDYVTPRQFGELFYDLWGPTTGSTRKDFVDGFDSFYTFNNEAPQKPFQADVQAALELIPIELTDMRTWASSQNWD
ncbi:SDR family oxidoreductase [Trinickia violacea]|uniref:SDR family oxidoreductase n=1 Tax=Trinickia violacea TaxID=2571746 RepID=UPI0020C7F3E1|nr:NmrA family NAD(P)-binding protein [Trinickia violacea]